MKALKGFPVVENYDFVVNSSGWVKPMESVLLNPALKHAAIIPEAKNMTLKPGWYSKDELMPWQTTKMCT